MKKLIPNFQNLISKSQHHQALKQSLSLSSPSLTDQTYAHFIKSGHVLDTFLATSLITHFSKSGDFHRSSRFLIDAHDADTISFNALLNGYAKFNHSSACFDLYNSLLCNGLYPDRYTLSSLIKACDSLDKIKIAHMICVKFGFNLSGFLVSGLIYKYGKFGCVNSAEKCYEECDELDSVICTAMINGYVWNYEFEKGKEVFKRMRKLGFEFSEFSLTAVVGALSMVKEGEQIHGFAVKLGLVCGGSLHLSNVIMNMYARCGSRFDACKVFDEISDPDVVSWTARIGAASDGCEALEVFKCMHSNDLEANELTIVNVLSSIEDTKLFGGVRLVHSLCHKAGYLLVVSVGNALISAYGKCGLMHEAKLVFDELAYPDSISWNSLIRGYSENGLQNLAFKVFSQMRDYGIQPDQFSLASVLGAVARADYVVPVMQIHSLMIKCGLNLENSMLSCLISSYGKCYSLDCAKRVLSSVQELYVGHIQVMVASAISAGSPADALECFTSAMPLCFELDGDILSIVFKACSALTNLGQGKAIHSLALKSGLSSDRFVETAIVDFYCKCGCISDAESVFIDLSCHNLAAWNAMIMGYAQHGCYKEVQTLFSDMTELGIKPDEITYLGIIQSCCHAGLVNEAKVHLDSMYKFHGLAPCLEHYASMVDLLGRVGLVKEAKLVIDQMPLTPDAQVWQSLLAACNNAGDLEIGQLSARELLKLQPENDSAHILLSHLYAKARDWDAVRNLRMEMKQKFIYKEPGSSWTEVAGSVAHFLAEDASHLKSQNIYFCLQTLAQQMPFLEMEEECLTCVMSM